MMNNTTHTANPAKRFIAYLIDGLVIVMAVVIGSIIVGILTTSLGLGAENANESESTSSTLGLFIAIVYCVFVYFSFWYFAHAESGPKQATFGKRIMNLRVIKEDGRALTKKEAWARSIMFAISGLPFYLGIIWILTNKKRQGWHDLLVKSLVIKDKQ